MDGQVHRKFFLDLFIATKGTTQVCVITEELFSGFTGGKDDAEGKYVEAPILDAVCD